MKIIAKILLFLFTAFLTTPTIVSVLEKSCDISCFFNMSEEEHFDNEIIATVSFQHATPAYIFSQASFTSVVSEQLLKHDSISTSIFIPPPNVF